MSSPITVIRSSLGFNHSPPGLYPATTPLRIAPSFVSSLPSIAAATAAIASGCLVIRDAKKILVQLSAATAGTRTPPRSLRSAAGATPSLRRRAILKTTVWVGRMGFGNEPSSMALYLRVGSVPKGNTIDQ